jgi:hypothetical protein
VPSQTRPDGLVPGVGKELITSPVAENAGVGKINRPQVSHSVASTIGTREKLILRTRFSPHAAKFVLHACTLAITSEPDTRKRVYVRAA